MNELVIRDFLHSKGLNDYAVFGLMGNLYAESALNPHNLQNTYEKSLGYTDEGYMNAVDSGAYKNFADDRAGWGFAQWTYPTRKLNLWNFAKARGVSIGDLNMQLDFLWKELNESFAGVLAALHKVTSVEQASNIVWLEFEKPKDQSAEKGKKRAEYGLQLYNQFAATTGGGNTMKYNESNKPLVCMQTNSTCYKKAGNMTIRGILFHSTGANNPWLKRYVQPSDDAPDRDYWLKLLGKNAYGNDWNHVYREAGLNCWIGKLAGGTVTTVQTMPWNHKPWGCGGSCNDGWIQFEICEDDLNDKAYFDKCYREAIEITAYLCKLYNINPHGTVQFKGKAVPTILCHWDSYKLGFGNGHSDIYPWFNRYGKSMETVRDDVAKLLNGSASTPTSTPAQVNYQVKVIAKDGLNCWTTWSTGGHIVTTYAYGTVLTILQENNGWGFTGAGWVKLSYTEKVTAAVAPGMEDEDMDVKKFKELYNEMRKELQDNDAGTWSAPAREWAISTGLVVGGDKLPDGSPNYMWADSMTREQLVTVLYRFAQMLGKV